VAASIEAEVGECADRVMLPRVCSKFRTR